ncbi:tryptophan-rich sensory protein [Roseovarius sp. PS-C2]|uniref:TspO/MBR family protein n=1 Tax=Roseovarius sp. PS-C2 TaxID=2820814 RepID=UPI001C0BA274|nr:TspO/MBR family protein [Roseovarius sp. PS-C2]MBU3262150.1 tryptophan-rich sensory protein [Roseovarius sp. PS-C2]
MQKFEDNDVGLSQYSLKDVSNIGALLVFVSVVFGGGLAIGVSTLPGDWYAGLIKPWFNPPNWIFGPVWSVLYIAIAVGGWRTWQRDRSGLAMKVWIVQMIANFAWSPVFFAAHRIGLAFAVILLVLGAIAAFIILMWRRDRMSALPFAPYAVWVGFASILNGAILFLN